MTRESPSSGAARHLLPSREKGGPGVSGGHRATNAESPSPLVGEGARRADEGERTQCVNKTGFARSLRKNQTEHEATLWRLLRDRRFAGYKFRRQVPIGTYVADFVCFDRKLIIELDGSQHVESEHDKMRDRELSQRGFRVVRIWNKQLNEERNDVLEAIWNALQEDEV